MAKKWVTHIHGDAAVLLFCQLSPLHIQLLVFGLFVFPTKHNAWTPATPKASGACLSSYYMLQETTAVRDGTDSLTVESISLQEWNIVEDVSDTKLDL